MERLTATLATGEGVIEIVHLDSAQEAGLQVADAIAWGLAQRYEHGDSVFYERIQRIMGAELLVRQSKNGLSLEADSHR